MQSSTTKTLLNSVFVGTDEQWDRIQDLVAKMNRLTIQATHFMKYHLLLHPDTNFTNEKCSAILLLLNNPTRSAAAAEFRESMQQFRILIDQRHEEIRNFYQIAIYHGNQICSQYLTNLCTITTHILKTIQGHTYTLSRYHLYTAAYLR